MHIFDVILTSTGPSPVPVSQYSTRGYDTAIGAYDPATLNFGEAIAVPSSLTDPNGTLNSGRQCVVCSRTTPKTIFSCRYKVHDKNQTILSDYFKRPLDCGDLCDRCYRIWYKQKRAAKTKATKGSSPSQPQPQPRPHIKHHHFQMVDPSSRSCHKMHENLIFEGHSDNLVATHRMLDSLAVRHRHIEEPARVSNSQWLSVDIAHSLFPLAPPKPPHKVPPKFHDCTFESQHDQSPIDVECSDIVSNRDDSGEDDDDDHIVVHIEAPRRHKSCGIEEHETQTESDHLLIQNQSSQSRSLKRRCIDEEIRSDSIEELLWLSHPPRKSRRKATPLRSATRELAISAVHVPTIA